MPGHDGAHDAHGRVRCAVYMTGAEGGGSSPPCQGGSLGGMPKPAVHELTPTVYRVPTKPFDLVNSFVLLEDDGSVTLVDCGWKSAPPRIVAGLAALGKSPRDVQRIIVTHAHPDHAGGMAVIRAQTDGRVLAHADDAGFLERGATPPVDERATAGRLFNRLPIRGFAATPVAATVTDGELLDIAGGLRVVHTPGHTPGHVSLLHEASGALITGDAIFNVLGLRYSPAVFCTDVPLSRQTADRLGELDYEVAGFTHGAHVREGARERVRSFLTRRAAA